MFKRKNVKFLLKSILFIIVFFVLYYIFLGIFKFLISELLNNLSEYNTSYKSRVDFTKIPSLLVYIISQLISITLSYVISKRFVYSFNHSIIIRDKKKRAKEIFQASILIIIIWIIFDLIGFVLGIGQGADHQFVSLIESTDSLISLILIYLVLALVAPVVEEIMFRGVVQEYLKISLPSVVSIAITSLFFAVFHTGVVQENNIINNIYYLSIIFSISIVLCHYKEKTNNITIPMFIHSIFNSFQFIVLLLGIPILG